MAFQTSNITKQQKVVKRLNVGCDLLLYLLRHRRGISPVTVK